MVALRGAVEALPMETLKQEKGKERLEPAGEVREWELSGDRKVKLRADMEELVHQEVLLVLKEKKNSFAWSPKDIQGIRNHDS